MKIIEGIRSIKQPIKGSVVAIGVFDGVHIGHQKIVREAAGRAKAMGLKSVVLTFDPHPVKITHPSAKAPSLMSLAHRVKLISELGVDIIVVVKFTKVIANYSAERFVKNILKDKLGAREVFVSTNFYFGKGGRAGARELRRLAARYSFKVRVLNPVKISGRVVSSSLIRELVRAGDLRRAEDFLGRPVSILGTVIAGANLAREMGYPTANVNPHHEVVPPSGVYAVRVKYGRRLLNGILNIGLRPTFYAPQDREPAIEVHIFNFRGNIYGKDLEVLFVKKIRDEVRFKNREELIRQIKLDSRESLKIIHKVGRP